MMPLAHVMYKKNASHCLAVYLGYPIAVRKYSILLIKFKGDLKKDVVFS